MRTRSRPRGATAVEAAIVLPLVSLLLLACADIGRAIHAQIVVTNLARVGAEYGATHRFTPESRTHWESRLHEVMLGELSSIQNSSPALLETSIETTPASADEVRIRVTAAYPFRLIVAWPGFPGSLELTHAVTMRQYQ